MNGSHAEESGEASQRRKPSAYSLAGISAYCGEDITEKWADVVLIMTCFITGLLDGAVFNTWSCFVSMHTGNTVYVGLGVTSQPKSQPWRWVKSLTSIAAFVLGALIFSRVMRYFGPLKRGTIVGCFVTQALFCFLSAGFIAMRWVPLNAGDLLPDNFIVLLPLALLAAGQSGQIVVSRFLGYGDVTTVVLTSAYADLVLDEKVFTPSLKANVRRNRRVTAFLMLAAGAMLGGYLTEDGNISLSLWVGGALKLATAMVYVFWRSKEGQIRLE